MNNLKIPDFKKLPSVVELAESHRIDISRKLAPKKRSEMGQFMTPATIAQFMASLFDFKNGDPIHLLDSL